ncbi:MAG TPA: aconitate hydratase AcnA, partial [Solirubrobacterales bacterium]|nr:aconitate hydratase AcnA [Solirubrobacterales bacterium]
VVPSIAGPKRPQDRIALSDARPSFLEALHEFGEAGAATLGNGAAPGNEAAIGNGYDEAIAESFPASDPPAEDHDDAAGKPHGASAAGRATGERATGEHGPVAASAPPASDIGVPVRLADGTEFDLDHGRVVIAAITSCTNTSNPYVMVGAGLLARNALARGLARKPWVKTSLAPGSTVVTEYLDRAGLTEHLNGLQFNLVGYGCTTCIGNSGPLAPEISAAVEERNLVVCSVLSGNRNFEGRINQDVKANYLASPPLVVAYALAGRMDLDIETDPLGTDPDGEPVYLKDIWPDPEEVARVVGDSIRSEMFTRNYGEVFAGDETWRAVRVPEGDRYTWPDSTYVRRPSFFEGMPAEPEPVEPVRGARVLALLGDSITTDHISPAGAIKRDSPAGSWLTEQGVELRDFNSYGSRRGNHEVMIRGTFANIRLRNLMVERAGGYTRHWPDGEETSIYEAAMAYAAEGVPLVVLAGKEYGSGSSRDWAAKGTRLLGVRAVIAESFERIHRSNLIGMGVVPLQFPAGESVETLGLTGEEIIDLGDLENGDAKTVTVTARRETAGNGAGPASGAAGPVEFEATVRLDTPNEVRYLQHGGILQSVLRTLRDR